MNFDIDKEIPVHAIHYFIFYIFILLKSHITTLTKDGIFDRSVFSE